MDLPDDSVGITWDLAHSAFWYVMINTTQLLRRKIAMGALLPIM